MSVLKKTLVLILATVIMLSAASMTVLAAENDVCSVDGVGYTDFAAAINSAADGKTVKLEQSFTIDARKSISISNKAVILDLNGYTVTSTYDASNYYFITVKSGGSLTVKDNSASKDGCLKVSPATAGNGFGIKLQSGSAFTMESGRIEVTRTALDIDTSASNVKVEIKGGTIYSNRYVLNVRGNENVQVDIADGLLESQGTEGGSVIYLTAQKEGAAVVNITGGKLKSTQEGTGQVICGYNYGTVNFGGDAVIEANDTQGITTGSSCNINVNITGGSIYVNNTKHSGRTAAVSIDGNTKLEVSAGSITSVKGTALEADKSYGTGNPQAIINGGTFISESSGYSAKAAVIIGSESSAIVNGGTFIDNTGKGSIIKDDETATVVISGGEFSSLPAKELFAEGVEYEKTDDGNYIVGTAAAQIDDTNYVLLSNAIAEAQPGDTIKLLKNIDLAENTSLQIEEKGTADMPITLDLNSFTISGSNKNSGNLPTTQIGIVQVIGSYVIITDNSEIGTKGTLVNTFSDSKSSTSVLLATTGSYLTLDGGINIENNNKYSSSYAIRSKESSVTVNNAVISGGNGYAFKQDSSTTNGEINDYAIVINGGKFSSAGKGKNSSLISTVSTTKPNIICAGGIFSNWSYVNMNILAADKAVCINDSSESFTVTVQADAPGTYTAKVRDEAAEADVYLISSNLCALRMSTLDTWLKGKTIEVAADASFAFPDGQSFGAGYGVPYELIVDLAEGVTLTGGMVLKVADITLTGTGTLDQSFTWTPYDDNYEIVYDEANRVYKGQINADSRAAELILADGSSIYYLDMSNAITGVNNNPGSTLKLLKNVSTSGLKTISKEATIDLNGKTWVISSVYLRVIDGGDVNIINTDKDNTGVIDGTNSSPASLIIQGGIVSIDEGVAITGNSVLLSNADNGQLTVSGTIDTRGTKNTPIMGNGSNAMNTVITIKEGAKIIADQAGGIYHPQDGVLNIEGGEISGTVGIYMKAGELNMTGGKVEATGGKYDYVHNGNGYNPTGDAIILEACDYPGGTPAAVISGGLVGSQNNQAVACYLYENSQDIEDKQFITGGSFSADVSAYIESNYSELSTGEGDHPFIVGNYSDSSAQETMGNTAVAKLRVNDVYVYYTSLQEALTKATSDDTIILLADTDESITVNMPLLIQRNGYEAKALTAGDGYALLTSDDSYIILASTSGGVTNYNVKYYLENDDGSGYAEQTDDAQSDIPSDELGTALQKTYAGFYLDKVVGPGSDSTYHVYYNHKVYKVTVENSTGGVGSADPAAAKAGVEITLTATPDKNYDFKEWQVISGDINIQDNKFTMPTSDVVVKAIFTEKPAVTYALSFECNGGSSINPITREENTVINLSDYTTTRDGYTFTGWYSDKELKTKVTTVTLTENTKVYAGWEKVVVNPFTDVKESNWFYEPVMYVYDRGLMIGTSTSIFSPNMKTTRAMIVTTLYRMDGEPKVTGASPFTDVAEDQYYYDPVTWAAENDIAQGYGGGIFGPKDIVTREQLVVFFYRYADYKNADMNVDKADLNIFPDSGDISDYAVTAMEWAVSTGLVQGRDTGVLDPQGSATRAEIAQILMNFCEKIQ